MSEPTRESAPRRNDAARLIAALAIMPAMTLGGIAVPFTFQTLGIYITAQVLGGKRATAAVALYLLVGFAGLPIFARGSAGLGSLASPSAGYLLGFLPFAAIAGTLAYLFTRNTRPAGKLLRFCGSDRLRHRRYDGERPHEFYRRVQRGNGIRPLGSGEVRHRGSGRFVGAPRLPVPDFHPALETPPNHPRGSYVFPPLPAPEYTADRAGRAGG